MPHKNTHIIYAHKSYTIMMNRHLGLQHNDGLPYRAYSTKLDCPIGSTTYSWTMDLSLQHKVRPPNPLGL